jgi:hypothetical protein
MVYAADTTAVTTAMAVRTTATTTAVTTTTAAVAATVATSSNWNWRQIADHRAYRHHPDSRFGTGEC